MLFEQAKVKTTPLSEIYFHPLSFKEFAGCCPSARHLGHEKMGELFNYYNSLAGAHSMATLTASKMRLIYGNLTNLCIEKIPEPKEDFPWRAKVVVPEDFVVLMDYKERKIVPVRIYPRENGADVKPAYVFDRQWVAGVVAIGTLDNYKLEAKNFVFIE